MSISKLFLNRFAVYSSGKFVYDQCFHTGVNIIRGENGTGKSTIMDLICYALGAEITDWTHEQLKCDYVIAELKINDYVATVKRIITKTGQEKTFLFDGDMEKALSNEQGWEQFSMRRNEGLHSFSQHLFELLNLPRHLTDDSKNLTMHQILRLMYVDQLSTTTKLLKQDSKYDNITTRRAIGEYLLGIDTLEAYNLRQELILANKEFEKLNGELNAIYRMLGNDEKQINLNSLNFEIDCAETDLSSLRKKLIETKSIVGEGASKQITLRIKDLVKEIEELSIFISKLRDSKRELSAELRDTSLFIKSLEYRKKSLNESQLTSSILGSICFKYCPSCLEPIETNQDNACCLCKSPKSGSDKDFAYSQQLNELNFQIKENLKLKEKFVNEINTIESEISLSIQKLRTLKDELSGINISSNERDALIQKISTEIGFQQAMIVSLNDKKNQVSKINDLQKSKAIAQDKINSVKEALDNITERQEKRYISVYNSIESKAKNLLKLDGGYEISFETPEDVMFDFAKDKMFVNGRSKFSASSMVVMKNSIRFSIFAHAAEDEFARLPNLILMDNIEDKGMVVERSQNFQRNMVDACNTIKSEFQLIFTTSMIASELEGTNLCVGPFYPKGEHTLKF